MLINLFRLRIASLNPVYVLTTSILSLGLASCGDKGGDNKQPTEDQGGPMGMPQGGGGGSNPPSGNGQRAIQATVDLSGAFGLLVLDPSGGGSKLNLAGNTAEGEKSLAKIDQDGKIKSAISINDSAVPAGQTMQGPPLKLPRIATIAVSPHKDIYLHFDQAFIHKAVPAGVDPFNELGYMCQIFKVNGGTVDQLKSLAPTAPNLECIDDQHFVDNWVASRKSVFQFDQDSNVYYPGSLRNGGGKMVVYRRTRDGSSTTEVINANICVQDFLVTKNGGVFYTGASSCSGGDGSSGFFRYVRPAGAGILEIARGWWNFVFEPVLGIAGDEAVFFGPDPRESTTASWNSASLFRFDPTGAEAADRIDEVVDRGDEIWDWINMKRDLDKTTFGRGYTDGVANPTNAWKTEFARRCSSAGQVFVGGGSQISAIKQDSTGNVYVIGNLRKKKKGVIECNIQVKGAHCVRDGVPVLGNAAYDTQTECVAGGGLWENADGSCENLSSSSWVPAAAATPDACVTSSSFRFAHKVSTYNNVRSDLCSDTTSTYRDSNLWDWNSRVLTTYSNGALVSETPKFNTDWNQCQPELASKSGGDQWTDEYRALAKVDSTTNSLSMLSSSDEQAVKLWMIDDQPYYSSAASGVYSLKSVNPTTGAVTKLVDQFETYNLSDGRDDDTLFYDGLDFKSNTYNFGALSLSNPSERTSQAGLTGTVKTILILPQ